MSKVYKITNSNVSFYASGIAVPLGGGKEDINDGLANSEMDISIDWGDGWAPSSWEALKFDYESPDTSKLGNTTLVGYIDLVRFQADEKVALEYCDPWDKIQDKIPFSIRVTVDQPEEIEEDQ